MKFKAKILALGLISALVLPTTLISAGEVETREAQDCEPKLEMYNTSAWFAVMEWSTNKNTEKAIDGYYKTRVNGSTQINIQNVSEHLYGGNISVTKNAYHNNYSIEAVMNYYLNGSYRGTLTR